jgi:hypothetical protein
MMTQNIAKALQHLFPGTKPGIDYMLQDDGDGPYIKEWNMPGEMPTEDQINQASNELGEG